MIKVELIGTHGDDLMIVNAARVSHAKRRENIGSGDLKLIKYLLDHSHWSPFEHPTVTFHVECPIYVARQIFRHKHSFNEVSGRYVEFEEKAFYPESFRRADPKVKQGSKQDEMVETYMASLAYRSTIENCYKAYQTLLDEGVCKEQARGVLPQAHITEFYETMNLRSFLHFAQARLDPHAQKETREVVQMMLDILRSVGFCQNTLNYVFPIETYPSNSSYTRGQCEYGHYTTRPHRYDA